ncbi:MAG: UDP-N-acetylmuramoyl-L-alanyl-D-glutamate--2,6-diaminopimelate ligase [Desulfocapsaceae bacterium]|nr:UDP-N-acetylmuramoyl-L-alanyl-D-glutamate--2,6-diaminopimelate ligase [Desulfocapsaceae bacterium]
MDRIVERQKLNKVLGLLDYQRHQGPLPSELYIAAIVTDSRDVTEGSLFVAVQGEKLDGHDFIGLAAASGCAAVLIEHDKAGVVDSIGVTVPVYSVKNTREALGQLAAALYDYPQKELTLIGITGTNGKTTTTYLLEKVLVDQGQQVGVLGTVSYRYNDRDGKQYEMDAPLTTPDPLILQKMLRKMADQGVETVVMEVSSHALIQQRLGGLFFDIAAFTNLSHDHLDYHPTMEEYFQAKSLLFLQHLSQSGKAIITFSETDNVLNNTWPSALAELLEENNLSYLSCGRREGSIVEPLSIDIEIDKTTISLSTTQGTFTLVSPLVGRFNVDNIMTTLAVTAALGYNIEEASNSLSTAFGAPGRLERIRLQPDSVPPVAAFVDYAHTPDALANVLSTLKSLPHRRLLCVFGCGGDRDTSKRPEMGRIAAEHADIAIITDDNPRTEPSAQVLAQIIPGVQAAGLEERHVDWLFHAPVGESGYVVIPERKEAIHRAVEAAAADDIVVIAGKGHEKYQLTNEGKRFFDDGLEVREAMLVWNVNNVTEALEVKPRNPSVNTSFRGVSTDSRNLTKGEIFVALRGENFDGHAYISQAIDSGASGLVVDDLPPEQNAPALPVFQVGDTLVALGKLAKYKRQQLAALSAPTVIGITGSTGKTTVKEMISAIFHQQWPDRIDEPTGRVLKTQGNFNNLIGLPLSLLPLRLKHEVAILEMGMNTPGEISRLTEIADPDISCIVNIHGAHLEGMGSIEGVAREKAELFKGTRPDGTLVVNLDDSRVAAVAAELAQRKIGFTIQENLFAEATLYASDIVNGDDGNVSYILHIASSSYPVNLKVPGQHNVSNSLAAATVAYAAGVTPEVIISGLEAFSAADKRLQIVQAAAGYSIINDTYNANPASMEAGLVTLQAMKGEPKVAVLSDMLELGSAGVDAHIKIGRVAARSGLTYLCVVGDFAEHIAEGALSEGMAKERVIQFSNKNDISAFIKAMVKEGGLAAGGWVFVKASRGKRLESVVESLLAT